MKSLSVRSSPNIYGQMVIDILVNPPKHGNPSFEKHEAEKEAILSSLAVSKFYNPKLKFLNLGTFSVLDKSSTNYKTVD